MLLGNDKVLAREVDMTTMKDLEVNDEDFGQR